MRQAISSALESVTRALASLAMPRLLRIANENMVIADIRRRETTKVLEDHGGCLVSSYEWTSQFRCYRDAARTSGSSISSYRMINPDRSARGAKKRDKGERDDDGKDQKKKRHKKKRKKKKKLFNKDKDLGQNDGAPTFSIRMMSAIISHGGEYVGSGLRVTNTALSDRCRRSCMQALSHNACAMFGGKFLCCLMCVGGGVGS